MDVPASFDVITTEQTPSVSVLQEPVRRSGARLLAEPPVMAEIWPGPPSSRPTWAPAKGRGPLPESESTATRKVCEVPVGLTALGGVTVRRKVTQVLVALAVARSPSPEATEPR